MNPRFHARSLHFRMAHPHLIPWISYAPANSSSRLCHHTLPKFLWLLRNAADHIIDAIAIPEYVRDRASP